MTANVCVPSASGFWIVKLHAPDAFVVAVPRVTVPSSSNSTVFGSAVPVSTGCVTLVRWSLLVPVVPPPKLSEYEASCTTGAAGGVVSIVTVVPGPIALVAPVNGSLTRTVTWCAPSASDVPSWIVQLPLPPATPCPTDTPSTNRVTK
ncbi:Uncharacterised protein [Burkholderia pseudomallei]|nr:Uncharacterised protein [Burkholderia pseudomallei]